MKSKHLLLLLLMALLAPWAAQAQTVTVCEGTENSSVVPFDGYNADAAQHNQMIFPADGLTAMNGKNITQMVFYIDQSASNGGNTAPERLGTWTVSLGETEETTLSGLDNTTTLTQVYQGYFDCSTGTLTLAFDADYTYHGGNLLVDLNHAAASWNRWYFLGVTATGASYTYGSQRNFLPQTTFSYETPSATPKPTGLTVSNITHNEATLSWTENGTATSWQICLNDDEDNLITVTENPYTFTNLTATTAYTVKVRSVGTGEYSAWSNTVNFSTTAEATAVGDSWSDDFEGDACGWELVNGTLTNAWAWGTATNNGGTYALYVSNDGGTTNAYSNNSAAMVYATKLLNFAEGKYEFAYDWNANGESNYDYLRVALVPASVTLTAGTSTPSGFGTTALPTGWIALDGGSKLNQATAWQSQSVAVNVPAGNYYLVMAWRNDGGGGTTPPAAVDNVSITRVACGYDVEGLAVNNITTTTAAIAWTAGEPGQWQVAIKEGADEWDIFPTIANTNTYTITGLNPSTNYQVKVRAYCGGSDYGSWCEPVSFATECDIIPALGYSENFDDYTVASANTAPSARVLPNCWSAINTTTYSSYMQLPSIYYYSYTNYANTTPNCLKFYSSYSSYSSYDPQPQYAILPEMSGLAGKQVTLQARGTNATSTFKIGTMSDPTDASTFTMIAEQTLTTSYPTDAYEFIVPATCTDSYLAIMIDAADADRTTNGVYIDDISIAEAPACPKPTNLEATTNAFTATITWESEVGEYEVAYSTDNTANPDENIAGTATEETYTMNDLALGDHYFWVRANCGSDGYSEWVGPVSAHIGYCVPTPSNVDGNGISNVTFGMGDNIVNNDTPKATYADYSSQIGAVQAGVESTIAITYATGYDYGTIIWVDLDNSLSFEDSEIVYTGTSGSANPTTLNAAITIPATQTPGDYMMRIGGADSGFDSYISGSTTTAPSACYTGSWACFQDYTLRVLEAPSCLIPTNVAINYTGGTEATISWTSEATAWNIDVNGTVTAITENPYTLTGLELATTYEVKVQADCGDSQSDWTNAASFTTDLCMPENQCEITFELTDSYGDGWNGAYIAVVDVATGTELAQMTNENLDGVTQTPETQSLTLAVCDGREITFEWHAGSFDDEASYVVYDINGEVIFEGSDAMSAPVNYTVSCTVSTCRKPTDLAYGNLGSTTAVLSWTENGEATEWVVAYKTAEDTDFTEVNAATNPFTLEGLTPETAYTVKVKPECDVEKWSDEQTFTTMAACSVDNVSISDVTHYTANVGWDGESADGFTVKYRTAAGINASFSEGFENGIGSWSLVNCQNSTGINSSANHSGSNGFRFYYRSNPPQYLISPELNGITEGTKLEFYYKNSSTSYTETFMIGTATTTGTTADEIEANFTFGDEISVQDGQWHLYSATIPAGTTYICFKLTSDNAYFLYIDDIVVGVEVAAGVWQTVSATASPANLEGLEAGTEYDLTVVPNCDETLATDIQQFTTLADNVKIFVTEGDWNEAGNWMDGLTPTLNDNAQLQANATITGLATADNVTFASGKTLTIADGGQLQTNTAVAATVQKHISGYSNYSGQGNGGYYLIANPLSSAISTSGIEAAGLLNGDYDLYSWSWIQDYGLEWANYKLQAFSLDTGTGYLYANQDDVDLTFTGTVVANGSTASKLIHSDYISGKLGIVTLAGNPFVCNAYLVDADNAPLSYYKMNDDGDVITVSTAAIAPMEGIFYQTNDNDSYIYFTRETPAASTNNGSLTMSLTEAGTSANVKDNAMLRFGNGNVLEKFSFREGSSKVYIPQDGKDYAVVNVGNVGEVPVSFKAERNGAYTLSFNNENVTFSYLHLVDNMAGADIDLLETPSYTFDARYTDYATRFKLVFATGATAEGESFGYVNAAGNLCVFGIEGTATLQVIDVTGRILSSETFSGGYEKRLNASTGVYMLRLINGNNVKVQKMVVK